MEYVEQQNIKKYCNFYVSEIHLSVMLLPYISKQINEDVEIATIFEKLDKENIEKILNKMNVKNKEKILNINWFNNTKDIKEKIERLINNNIKNNKKITIIIGGNKNYILEQNKNIINFIKENNIKDLNLKLINCFNVEEVKNSMKTIVEQHNGVVNTSGEINVNCFI